MKGQFALLWSGGKDCSLALARARSAGVDVARLISIQDASTGLVRFHGTPVGLLALQAAAAGVRLEPVTTTWDDMDRRLRQVLLGLHNEGFSGVVLGDIHLADVRDWYERRVTAAGLEHLEPLWGEEPARLLDEFVVSGGRAVVTCIDSDRLDPSWLGRTIDRSFAAEIAATGADPCGENGEYHSFAYAGPIFKTPIAWTVAGRGREGKFEQLLLSPAVSASPST